MPVHPLHEDFFSFLSAVEAGEEKWGAFERLYFGRHRPFLSRVWFDLQGYTAENIRERALAVGRGDYADLEASLGACDLAGDTEAIVDRCARACGEPPPCDVILFVGFFSPDAFVAVFEGAPVVCVGLERFHGFRGYPLLLAHEYGHLLTIRALGEARGGVVERAVREGIATRFSALVYPETPPHALLFMKEGPYRELLRRFGSARDAARALKAGETARHDLFHGIGDGTHPRAGYFLGHRIVEEFAARRGVNDPLGLIACWEEIFVDFDLA